MSNEPKFAKTALAFNKGYASGQWAASDWNIRQAKRWSSILDRKDVYYNSNEVNFIGVFLRDNLKFLDGKKAGKDFLLHPFQ